MLFSKGKTSKMVKRAVVARGSDGWGGAKMDGQKWMSTQDIFLRLRNYSVRYCNCGFM